MEVGGGGRRPSLPPPGRGKEPPARSRARRRREALRPSTSPPTAAEGSRDAFVPPGSGRKQTPTMQDRTRTEPPRAGGRHPDAAGDPRGVRSHLGGPGDTGRRQRCGARSRKKRARRAGEEARNPPEAGRPRGKAWSPGVPLAPRAAQPPRLVSSAEGARLDRWAPYL